MTSYGKNPEDHYLNGLNFYPREERQFAVVKPLKPLYLSDAADSDFGIADDYYDYLFNNIPANSKNAGSMDEMRVWIAKRNGAHRILPNCSCPNKVCTLPLYFLRLLL